MAGIGKDVEKRDPPYRREECELVQPSQRVVKRVLKNIAIKNYS